MQWNNFWLWIVGVCRSCVCVCVLSVSLPSLWDFHASLIDYVKWADALIWCGSSSSISMPLSRFMSSTVGVGQMHKDDNTLHCMTTYFLNTHTCSPYKGSIWWGFKCKIKVKNVFFPRRFRGRNQAAQDHHHSQAAGDPQKCLQELAKASTPRQGTAVLGDGTRHEGGAGGDFLPFSGRRAKTVSFC